MSDEAWSSPDSGAGGGVPGGYVRLHWPSRILLALLGAELLALGLVSLLDPLITFLFPSALEDPQGVEIALVLGMGVLGLGSVLCILLALPLWVYWHYQAGANLRALGFEDLQYTPAAHAYWWFVPFANLVMPYRTTLELFKASRADAPKDEWILGETPSLFPVWWGCWLGGNILQNVSNRLAWRTDFVEAASVIGLIASPFMLGALGLYMYWVWQISSGLDARAEAATR